MFIRAKRFYDGAWSLIGYSKPSIGMVLEGFKKNKEVLRVLASKFQQIKFSFNPDCEPLLPLVDMDSFAVKKNKEREAIENLEVDPSNVLFDSKLLFDQTTTTFHFINIEINDITQRVLAKIQSDCDVFSHLKKEGAGFQGYEQLCDIGMHMVISLYQAVSQVEAEIQWLNFVMTTTKMSKIINSNLIEESVKLLMAQIEHKTANKNVLNIVSLAETYEERKILLSMALKEKFRLSYSVEANEILAQKIHEHGLKLNAVLMSNITLMRSVQDHLAVQVKIVLSDTIPLEKRKIESKEEKTVPSTPRIMRSLSAFDVSAIQLKEPVLSMISSGKKAEEELISVPAVLTPSSSTLEDETRIKLRQA